MNQLPAFRELQKNERRSPEEIDEAFWELEGSVQAYLNARDTRVLREINAALDKISGGEYGYCEDCGEAIEVKRLQLIPEARLCVHCQDHIEKKERGFFRLGSLGPLL